MVFEAKIEHLIGLVKYEHFDRLGLESSSLYHVENTTWSATHDVDTMLKLENVIIHISASDAAVNFDTHVITKRQDNFLRLLG